jgi:HD-GYP domain-containing protein (c-di-GMP phosphodiesterase class II)
LQGEQIPLGARLLAIADAFDVLRSDRPYRVTKSFQEARQEIQRCAGTQFDPQVVQVFLQLTEEKGANFFKNSAVIADHELNATFRGRYLKKSQVP